MTRGLTAWFTACLCTALLMLASKQPFGGESALVPAPLHAAIRVHFLSLGARRHLALAHKISPLSCIIAVSTRDWVPGRTSLQKESPWQCTGQSAARLALCPAPFLFKPCLQGVPFFPLTAPAQAQAPTNTSTSTSTSTST
eukprot:CAMPEP_0174356964 /NCGR_PEP_ID=MMETSP0811_2-20130205/33042_1 /TAXON_ID=73025 ORGANISM="Eutreptiella gymnastica-like, Strain CCMP1594" /NCGR_SAMPLE_ID=MMETSP0811_2 /ASSEMBLY_ACC=CAM_ASM_000667 /LENGTH=140 /DNA_ID=CAMNT_0015489331 /DNA_START=28 /DNA_END=446 /DNA_ORIENTATION=-